MMADAAGGKRILCRGVAHFSGFLFATILAQRSAEGR